MRIIGKWPLDTSKGKTRDIGVILRNRFASEFKDGDMTEVRDVEKCDRILASLDNIVNDKHNLKYQCDIKIGAMGHDAKVSHNAVSDKLMNQLKKASSPFLSSLDENDNDTESENPKNSTVEK